MRHILRWSIGPCSNLGIDVLKESVRTALDIFKGFEFYIGYNNIDPDILQINDKIKLHKQDFNEFYIPIDFGIPVKRGNPKTEKILGSYHKVIPARIDLNAYELLVDNDLVFLEMPDKIKEFLSSDKTLLCESSLKFQGSYAEYFLPKEQYTSSLMGLPPGFDFESYIKSTWKKYGETKYLTYNEEQGLLTLSLKNDNSIILSKDEIVEVFYNNDLNCKLNRTLHSKAKAFHFVGVNRNNHHQQWTQYKIGN